MKLFIQKVAVCFLSIMLLSGTVQNFSLAQSSFPHSAPKQTATKNEQFYKKVILPDILKNIAANVSTEKQKIERTLVYHELYNCKTTKKVTVYAVYIEVEIVVTDILLGEESLTQHKAILGQHLIFRVEAGKIVNVYPFEPFVINAISQESM